MRSRKEIIEDEKLFERDKHTEILLDIRDLLSKQKEKKPLKKMVKEYEKFL